MSLSSRLNQLRTAAINRTRSPADGIGLLRDCARCLGDWFDRGAIWIYGTLAALMFATCQIAIARFTIEPDESWILLSTFKAFRLAVPGSQEINFPPITSGGLHLLIHGVIGIFTRSITVHRSVSLLFLAALVVLVFDSMHRHGAGRRDAAIATTLVLATPGLVLQSALAMAEIIVTVLLLATALYWERRGRLSLSGSVLTGVLLGLSCATRANCLVCIPVFVIFACLDADDWLRGLSRGSAMLIAACATYAIGVFAYAALFTIGDWGAFKAVMFAAAGVSGELALAQRFPYIFIAADFFSPLLIAVLLVGIVVCLPRGIDRLRLPLLLVALGFAGAVAWVAKAPIPHVRYAWPFAPFLFVAAGILMHLTGLLAQNWTRLIMHLFVIASGLKKEATSFVYIVTGDSLVAVYQANRQAGLNIPIASHSSIGDQGEMAQFIAALPANADLTTYGVSLGFPLTY